MGACSHIIASPAGIIKEEQAMKKENAAKVKTREEIIEEIQNMIMQMDEQQIDELIKEAGIAGIDLS